MVVCMPTTVAGGGRKCYEFCGGWGFDETQDADNIDPQPVSGRQEYLEGILNSSL